MNDEQMKSDIFHYLSTTKAEHVRYIYSMFDSVAEYISYKEKALNITEFLELVYPNHPLLDGLKDSINDDEPFHVVVSVVPHEHPVMEANRRSKMNNYRRTLEEMASLTSGAFSFLQTYYKEYELDSIFVYIKPEFVDLAMATINDIVATNLANAGESEEENTQEFKMN